MILRKSSDGPEVLSPLPKAELPLPLRGVQLWEDEADPKLTEVGEPKGRLDCPAWKPPVEVLVLGPEPKRDEDDEEELKPNAENELPDCCWPELKPN